MIIEFGASQKKIDEFSHLDTALHYILEPNGSTRRIHHDLCATRRACFQHSNKRTDGENENSSIDMAADSLVYENMFISKLVDFK